LKKIVITDDYQLSKVQDAAVESFSGLPTQFPVINGNTVTATAPAATTDFAVNHKLGRAIAGWIVVRKNANANVWESATANPRPTDQVIFQASAKANLTFYFF